MKNLLVNEKYEIVYSVCAQTSLNKNRPSLTRSLPHTTKRLPPQLGRRAQSLGTFRFLSFLLVSGSECRMRLSCNSSRRIPLSLHFLSRRLMSSSVTMARSIKLTDREATLRKLLLDVSSFISRTKSCPTPELRFTGGWVRDKLLGTSSHDIDISISSVTGKEFANSMKHAFDSSAIKSEHGPDIIGYLANIPANPEKSKHLETVTTKILGFDVDLVNLRKETYCEDSRNPTVEHGTPEEDAFRRDSTVNALFYNLQTGEVEDFTGRGLEDLEAGLIKTPLDPYQTFKDDPLRILRSIRFASRLGFRINPGDEQAMSDKDNQEALRLKISRERFGVEITKMLRGW